MTEGEIAKLKDDILFSLVDGEKFYKRLDTQFEVDPSIIWTLSEDISDDGYLRERLASSKDEPNKALTLTQRGELFLKTSSYLSLAALSNQPLKYSAHKTTKTLNPKFQTKLIKGLKWSWKLISENALISAIVVAIIFYLIKTIFGLELK